MSETPPTPAEPAPDAPSAPPPSLGSWAETPAPKAGAPALRPGRLWAFALGLGFVAGLVSFGVGESTNDRFPPRFGSDAAEPGAARGPRGGGAGGAETPRAPSGQPANPEVALGRGRDGAAYLERRAFEISAQKTATLAFGVLGGLLGLGLGLAGGLASRSIPRALAGGLTGLILGGALGAGVSYWGIPVYQDASYKLNNLSSGAGGEDLANQEGVQGDLRKTLYPLALHGAIWGSIGLASGLALGLGLGGRWIGLAVAGGLLGSLLGTVLFEYGGPVVFGLADPPLPLPEVVGARLLAHLGIALLTSAGAAWAVLYLRLTRGPAPAKAA